MSTDEETRDAILSVMYEKVEDDAQIPTILGSMELVDTVTEALDGADEEDVLYFVDQLDDSHLIEFSKHSDGHGPIKIIPQLIDEYDQSSPTFLSDGRMEEVLETFYEHDKETRGQPLLGSKLHEQTGVDDASIGASIWYLHGKRFVDANVDNQGWHNPSITESGRKFYERRYQ